MKIRNALALSAVCCFVSACGTNKDSNKNAASQSIERLNPEEIEGSFVVVGPWTLVVPSSDKLKTYYWEDDESLTKLIESSEIEFSAIVDSKGTQAKFGVKFLKNQCATFKTIPSADEIGGKTLKNLNWFLKNDKARFNVFQATARTFDSCISMTIRSVDSIASLSENGDVVRYFKAIADKISFDRFIHLNLNVQRIGAYLVTSFAKGMDFSESDGITTGTSRDVVFTSDGKKNQLTSIAKTGDCESPIFKIALNDPKMEVLDSHAPGIDLKYVSKIVDAVGKYNRSVEGIFKNANDSTCLLLTFTLENAVESRSVVQDDHELDEKLVSELSATALVPKTQ